MVVIRLARGGRNKYPVYRIVAADSRRAATGKFIAILGTYNPHSKELTLEREEIARFLGNGAQPSNTVVKLLQQEKVELPAWVKLATRNRAPKKAVPEALAEAEAQGAGEVTEAEAEAEAAETETPASDAVEEGPVEPIAEESESEAAPAEEERVAEVATAVAEDVAEENAETLDHTETAADDEAAAAKAEATEEVALVEAKVPAEADSAKQD